jgi:hypothetical protein
VCEVLPNYTASHPKRQQYSHSTPQTPQIQYYQKVFGILKLKVVDIVHLGFSLVTLLAEPLQADESGPAGAHGIVRVGDVVPKRAVGFGSSGAERFLTWPTEVSLFAQLVARRNRVTHARCAGKKKGSLQWLEV